MSEMIERVALAIAARLEGTGCDCSRDFVRMDVARDLATLAIAAMREPTPRMEDVLINGVYGYGEAVTAYESAIDEALKS